MIWGNFACCRRCLVAPRRAVLRLTVTVRVAPGSMCHRDFTLQVTGVEIRLNAPPGDLKRYCLSVWDGEYDFHRVFVDGSLHAELDLAGAGNWWLLAVSQLTFYPG